MEKVSFIIRIAAIFALAFVAIVGILGCPDESLSFGQWLGALIVSKAIGFAAILGIVMLIGGVECVKAFIKGIFTKDVEPKHANY